MQNKYVRGCQEDFLKKYINSKNHKESWNLRLQQCVDLRVHHWHMEKSWPVYRYPGRRVGGLCLVDMTSGERKRQKPCDHKRLKKKKKKIALYLISYVNANGPSFLGFVLCIKSQNRWRCAVPLPPPPSVPLLSCDPTSHNEISCKSRHNITRLRAPTMRRAGTSRRWRMGGLGARRRDLGGVKSTLV